MIVEAPETSGALVTATAAQRSPDRCAPSLVPWARGSPPAAIRCWRAPRAIRTRWRARPRSRCGALATLVAMLELAVLVNMLADGRVA